MGGCAEGCAPSSKPPSDSRWSELLRVASRLPWQAKVLDELTGETELGVGGDYDPCPSVGLFWRLQRWRCPSQRPFCEPEGVLDVEPAEVGPPARSRWGSPSPDHHGPSIFLTRPIGLGRCSTSTLITLPVTIGGSSLSRHRPRPCSFGWRLCQACTVTAP